jgi:hypothetical protein
VGGRSASLLTGLAVVHANARTTTAAVLLSHEIAPEGAMSFKGEGLEVLIPAGLQVSMSACGVARV